MFRYADPMRALRLAAPLLLVLATPLGAQGSGPLAPPPLPPPQMEVGQSDPAYGRLRELYNDLVARQQAFNRQREQHNAQCLNIPKSHKVRIDWCNANRDKLLAEKDAYAARLKAYQALQAQYQGRTLYLRGDYAGAIAKYNEAMRLAGGADLFDGYIVDDIDLARAAQAEAQGRPEEAAALICGIDARKRARPNWFEKQMTLLMNKLKALVLHKRAKFNTMNRCPACCAVRG